MGLPADWSFMDQKTHFLFVLEGPEIILLTTSMPALIKHQALPPLRTPFLAAFPLPWVHITEVKNIKPKPLPAGFTLASANGIFCIFLAQMQHWHVLNLKSVWGAWCIHIRAPVSPFQVPFTSPFPQKSQCLNYFGWQPAGTTCPIAASVNAGVGPPQVLLSAGPGHLEEGLLLFYHLSAPDCLFTNLSRPCHRDNKTWQWAVWMFLWPLKVSGTAHRSGKGCRREGRTACILRHSSGCGLFQSDKTKAFCFQNQTTAASPNDARGPPCSHIPACNKGW